MEGGGIVSENGLKALVGIIAVLIVIWATVTYLPRGGGVGGAPPSEALAGFFQGVTPESVTSVQFREPGGGASVTLERGEGSWTVNGFRADSATVARFWEAVGEAKVADLVGSNPDNHPRLGVTADSAWTVEVHQAQGTRSLLVGKSGTRYGTAYVRLPDQAEVYLLEGGLRPTLTRALDDWRSKRIARVDTSAVQQIELDRGGARYTLQRADSTWVMADGSEADGTTVRDLLSELARMDASGFYGAQDSLPLLAGTLRALDRTGQPLFYMEIGSGEGDRWVRVEGDSILYRVASWRASRILPALGSSAGEG